MELDDVLNEPPKQEVNQDPPENTGEVRHGEAKTLARQKEREAQESGKTQKEAPKQEAAPEVKPEVKPEPPKQEMSDKERALLATATDERSKRQAIEKELAALRAAQTAAPKEPEKTFYEDPDGKLKSFNDQQAAFEAKMQSTVVAARLETGEMIARNKYPDFEEKAMEFRKLVESTPGIWQQALASPNPAEFAYKTAKNHMDLQAAGNIDQLKENLRKEIRLQVEQENKDKQEAAKKERDSIPPSLSQARGSNQHRPVWNGPPSLDNVLSDD